MSPCCALLALPEELNVTTYIAGVKVPTQTESGSPNP